MVYTLYILLAIGKKVGAIMLTNIAKWGNSHAIRLTKELMEQAKLCPNDKVTITVNGDEIVLKKVIQTKAAAFDELFKDYKGDWRCAEVDAGMALGKEVIE